MASLVGIAGNKIYKMDSLDGTWDDITSAVSITTGYKFDFASFQNALFMTNGNDNPFDWDATRNGKCSVSAVVAGASVSKAKAVEVYNNYLFYGNVTVSGTAHPSRIYWCALKDSKTWSATSFIDISLNDGQEITKLQTLGDRLVIFKTRSIYNLYFTGDADVPFILPNGGKSNSSVGCIAPYSVQEVDNGLVFLAYDGFYFYDGLNSFKISDRISATLDGLAKNQYGNAVSCVQKEKNMYLCGVTTSGGSENDTVIVWNYFHNAWSKYDGLDPCYMTSLYVSNQERPYWGDYSGFVYRGDNGADDYPLNVQTAINAYYWTNWRSYGDAMHKKTVAHLALYHQIAASTLTFGYSYDLETSMQQQQLISFDTASDTWGSALWDDATWAAEGGMVKRVDCPLGRGRVVRFKFSNATKAETFQIDGFGSLPHIETVE